MSLGSLGNVSDENDENDETTNTNTLPKCSSLPRLLVRLSVCLFVLNSLTSLNSLIEVVGTRYTKRYVEFRLANDDSIDELHAGTLIDKQHKLVALIKEVVAHDTRAHANVQYATL